MQTGTTQRAVKARVKAPAPVRPRLLNTNHPGFWLAILLINQAEIDAVSAHRHSKTAAKWPQALVEGMWNAERLMKQELQLSLGYVQKEGLLPFAHAHTTYFDQQVAA